MTLSPSFINSHITRWEATLTAPSYPYRAKWPSRLFHHGPIENIIAILQDGNLRSRLDLENTLPTDIAGEGVIDTRQDAHNFARLYFRPKTPTQFHIEGIRKQSDCQYGRQAPILVMFVFDARAVLTRLDTRFSDRNMQIGAVPILSTEGEFAEIPFDKVFHEGGIGGDRSIVQHRCAEVLAPSPLPLSKSLQWIYCRSVAEKELLLFLLDKRAADWERMVRVSSDPMLFNRRFPYVEVAALSKNDLQLQINSRFDGGNIGLRVDVWDAQSRHMIKFFNGDMSPRPPSPATRWRFDQTFKKGVYRVEVRIEELLAYASEMLVTDTIV